MITDLELQIELQVYADIFTEAIKSGDTQAEIDSERSIKELYHNYQMMVLSQGEPLSPQEQMIMEESVEVEINNLMSVYRTLAKSDDLDGLASLTEEEISQYLELLLGPEINDEL